MSIVRNRAGDKTMFTDPMLGPKCAAVDKIVNETWREWKTEPDEEDPFRSPIVVLARLFMRLSRWLWRMARQVHLSVNAPVSDAIDMTPHHTSSN
jgi:hypothetical protein